MKDTIFRLWCQVLVISLFLVPSSVRAHSAGTWTHIPEACGKQMEVVGAMAAGKDGSIWVGSVGGLFRYKDNVWYDESTHLGDVLDIVVAPDGDVWVCSNQDSLVKFDGEYWYGYNYKPNVRFNNIAVDANGIVWCSSWKTGILRFDGSTWKLYTTTDGLLTNGAACVSVSLDGVPWVSYGDPYEWDAPYFYGGIARFNGDMWENFDLNTGLLSDETDEIAFGPDGSVYVSYGTSDESIRGIMRFDNTSWEKVSDKICGKMVFDKNGILWAYQGSDWPGYVVIYNGISWKNYTEIISPSAGVNPRREGQMAIRNDGQIWLGTSKGVMVFFETTGIGDEREQQPHEYRLLSNYPNPFNPSTVITFHLPTPEQVKLEVYYITGSKVAVLADTKMSAGTHSVEFDGSNLASGVYVARLETNRSLITRKMLLIK